MVDILDDLEEDNEEDVDIDSFIQGKRIKVPSAYPLKIYREEMAGKVVYLYTGKGDLLGTVILNKPGNKQFDNDLIHLVDQTYTYTLPNGYKVLLTVPQAKEPPFLFTVGANELIAHYRDLTGQKIELAEKHCRLMVENDGSLNIRDMESLQSTEAELVSLLDPDKDGEIVTGVEKSQQVPKEWMQISLREDQVMCLHTGDFCRPKAVIYKVPNLWYGYMIREINSGKLYPLDGLGHDNDFYTFSYNGGLTLQVRQYDGILEIKAEGMLFCDKLAGQRCEYVEAGEDGSFSGKINGGRPIAGFTVKSVGGPELSKYERLNEDSYCVNYMNGRVVVADGVGGQMHGEHAAELTATWIANSQFTLNEAIYNAQAALQVLGSAIKVRPPDAVFAVAEFQGDFLNVAHTGDCSVIHVTKEEENGVKKYCVSETRPHTVLETMIEDKDVTRREAYTNPDYLMLGISVTSTLLSAKIKPDLLGGQEVDQVEYEKLILKKGDYVLLMSDGAQVLTDEDIVEVIENCSDPEQIAVKLKGIIRKKNKNGEYLCDFHDGKPPAYVRAAMDNTTVVVVRHD